MTTTTFKIFYMRPTFFRDGTGGYGWLKKIGKLPVPERIAETHIELKDLTLPGGPDPARVFGQMQGEVWSPNGEARELIQSKGLQHTSMSVGDVVAVPERGEWWLVDRFGFKKLEG